MTQLATIPGFETAASEQVELPTQYLTFFLGHELFAAPIAVVREVIEFPGLTRIPLTPKAVPGVINLRGAVVPVIDLGVRFGRAATQIGKRTCIIVVEVPLAEGLAPLGVLVDAVSEALFVERHQVESAPGFGAGLRNDFVSAMLNLEGRFVVVLDMFAVLSVTELEQLVSHSTELETASQDARL